MIEKFASAFSAVSKAMADTKKKTDDAASVMRSVLLATDPQVRSELCAAGKTLLDESVALRKHAEALNDDLIACLKAEIGAMLPVDAAQSLDLCQCCGHASHDAGSCMHGWSTLTTHIPDVSPGIREDEPGSGCECTLGLADPQ